MRWTVGSKIAMGFIAIVLIFMVVATVSYRATQRLIETSDLRRQTFEVLTSLGSLLTLVQDIEIGQRSYALVGDDDYLTRFSDSTTKIQPALATLRRLTANNARQQKRLDQLEPLVRNRIEFARQTIAVRQRDGAAAAAALINAGTGKALMSEVRRLVTEMEDDEEAVLKVRVDATNSDAETASRTILFGTATALLLAILAAFLINHNVAPPLAKLTSRSAISMCGCPTTAAAMKWASSRALLDE
jgi:CHASE3 domain sensor protein